MYNKREREEIEIVVFIIFFLKTGQKILKIIYLDTFIYVYIETRIFIFMLFFHSLFEFNLIVHIILRTYKKKIRPFYSVHTLYVCILHLRVREENINMTDGGDFLLV